MIYVSQIIMLYTLNLHNYITVKLEEKMSLHIFSYNQKSNFWVNMIYSNKLYWVPSLNSLSPTDSLLLDHKPIR